MPSLLTIDLDAPCTWPKALLSAAAAESGRRAVRKRATNAGGRPAMSRACPYCGEEVAGRANLQEHKRNCKRT